MSDENICPRCGGRRPANSPAGLCPKCLLGLALLHDHTDDGPMPAATRPDAIWGLATDQGRYRLMGEIARGGMGAILKGRDVGLGRDLAVKVILEEHRDRPDMVRRFVEEAQIGGQLEHPGIVPVHEIGRFADGRLYIAMKLVQGRTLAAFLAARRNQSDDRARLLSVFEQVCQTMAYAHARAVVHRDLKPSNVMLGSFGEVQVMDWGLAKVLDGVEEEHGSNGTARSQTVHTLRTGSNAADSRADSVVGTPAYMAPEQARGALDTADERADVFALGSILCEILTGAPAYTGGTSSEVQSRATRADLGEAFERLDRSGAEGELVVLAKACLAAAPRDRPRDAGIVLTRLNLYLAGVQERLTAAGLARAQAEARAAEERKRRLLTMALAASVLAIALVSGGAWAWMTGERTARIARTDQAVNLSLDEATRKAALAQTAPGGESGRWIEAIEAVRRAEAILAQNQGSAEVAARLRAVGALINRERMEAESVGKDRRTVERLVQIHDDLGVHGESARAEAEWAAAFRDYGVDLEALVPAEAGLRLASSPVAAELAGGLDQWIFLKRTQRPPDLAGTERLLTVAKLADPDPWRNRLRDNLNERVTDRGRTRAALEELAAGADADTLPEASVTRLAFALFELGSRDLAISLLRRTQRAHPNDFWVNCDLAKRLAHTGQLDEAIRFFSVALAVRPRSEMALNDLGDALYKSDRLEESAATFRRSLALGRDNPWAHAYLGMISLDLGRPREASAEFEAARIAQPHHWFLPVTIADLLLGHGHWDWALDLLRTTVRQDPQNAPALDKLGLTLLESGRIDDAIESFQQALGAGPRPFPPIRGNLCRALVAKGEFAQAIKSWERPGGDSPGAFNPGRGQGPDPALREAKRLAALEERLPALLAGKDRPQDDDERTAFAKLCAIRQLFATSARLWEENFASRGERPADLRAPDHYAAACSAALAGCGRGAELNAADRAACDRWRQQALAWLRIDLIDYSRLIASGAPRDRSRARKRLGQWQISPALAGIRDETALAGVSQSEREALRAFWSEVDAQRTYCQERGALARRSSPILSMHEDSPARLTGTATEDQRARSNVPRIYPNSLVKSNRDEKNWQGDALAAVAGVGFEGEKHGD
jgi:eukaryotic-like serine/threonine-protein kinase